MAEEAAGDSAGVGPGPRPVRFDAGTKGRSANGNGSAAGPGNGCAAEILLAADAETFAAGFPESDAAAGGPQGDAGAGSPFLVGAPDADGRAERADGYAEGLNWERDAGETGYKKSCAMDLPPKAGRPDPPRR